MAVIVAWKVAEYIVSVERYRPMLVTALQGATGLPASVGELDLTVFPSPRVVADDIVLGEGDFRMSIPRVSVTVWPWSLIRGRLDLSTVTLDDPLIQIPADPKQAAARFEQMASAQGNAHKAAGIEVDIARVRVHNGQVRVGDTQQPFATFGLDATRVLSESIPVSLDATLPELGDAARFHCEVVVGPRAGPSIRGSTHIEGFELSRLAEWAPQAVVAAQGMVDGSSLSRISLTLTGNVTSQAAPALNGSMSATAWWDSGSIIVNDIVWQSPAGTVSGDITRTPERDYAANVASIQLGPAAVDLISLWTTGPQFRITMTPDASVQVTDLALGITNKQELRLGKGALTFTGITIASEDGAKLIDGLHGRASVKQNAIQVDEFQAKGLALTGTVAPDLAAKAVRIELSGTGDLSQPLITELVPKESVQDMSGTISLRRIAGAFVPGKGFPPDFAMEGFIENGRFTFASPQYAKPFVIENVHGGFDWKQGALNLKDMTTEGVTLSGAVIPDWKAHEIAFDLTGRVHLEQTPLAAALPSALLSAPRGVLTLKRATGTFRRGQTALSGLRVEGTVTEGGVSIALSQFSDALSAISGQFTAQTDSVDFDLIGTSTLLGPVQCAGKYAPSTATWIGSTTCNLQRVGDLLPAAPQQKQILSSILSAYGLSTLQTSLSLPSSSSNSISFSAKRATEPVFDIAASLSRREAGWMPDSATVAADIPTESLGPLLPTVITSSGFAGVNVQLVPETQTFILRTDLAKCEIGVGQYLRKRVGDPMFVNLAGRRAEAGWQPETGSLTYNGVEIPVRFETGRMFCDTLDVDLASFSGLLASGGTANGRVRGLIATNPTTTRLQVENVAFALTPELAVQSVNGDVTYENGQWACRDLALLGAGSDFHVAGESQGRNWRGQLTGGCVDLNGIQALASAFQESEDAATPETVSAPFRAEMALNIDSLLYRRTRLERVTADLVADNDGIRTQNFQAASYAGTISGEIEITQARKPTPGRLRTALKLNQIDARILDEVMLEQPRGFSGTVSGDVVLDLPRLQGREVAKGANGHIQFTAQNGSFGKFGMGTKILAVLRTTEIFRLRLPGFKDEGLVYDACTGAITINQGILSLDSFQLQSPSYAMAAKGIVDFPRDTSDIRVRVQLLEVVAGVIQHVPVIGEAASKVAGIHLRVQGSPYEPTVSLDRIERAGQATKKVEDTAVTIIQDTIGNILKR